MSKLDDFLKQRQPQAGMASATPTTPVDTGPAVRPRMTLDEFLKQKQTAPQVSPEVAQDVATAPAPTQAPQEEPGMLEQLGTAAQRFVTQPITTATGAVTGLLAAGGETIQQLGAGMIPGGAPFDADQIRATALAGQQFGEQTVAPVVMDEALPIAGSIAATAVAPEVTIPLMGMKVAQWAERAGALGSIVLAGSTGLAGATSGEFVEQGLKKEGLLETTEVAPQTWTEVANRAIRRGQEEAAFNMGFAAVGSLALGGMRKLLYSPKTSNETFVQVMKEHDGPLLASDVSDAMVVRWAEVVAANTQQSAAKSAYVGTREKQAAILEEAMGDVVMAEAKKGGLEQHITDYGESLFKNLPSKVLADHVNVALKDSDKIAHSAVGVRYEALDDMLSTLGTKQVKTTREEVLKDPLTGEVKYANQPDPLFPWETKMKPIVIQREVVEEVPLYGVDMMGAKDVLKKQIEAQTEMLQGDAKVQFRDFATRQVNLLGLKDELTFKQARDYLKQMRAESRALQRSGDEFAPTKLKYLNDSITEVMKAMDTSADRMAAEGVVMDGMDVASYLKDTNKMWREADEAVGNPYIESVIKMSDRVEGAADSLALSFLQKSENAQNLLAALKKTEEVAGMPQKAYTEALSGTVLEKMTPTRAAISTKVAENLLGMLGNTGTRNKVIDMLANVERRSDLESLMGPEALDQVAKLTKAFTELEQSGVRMGSFMQLARETGGAIQVAESAAFLDPKGFLRGLAQVVGAPTLAAKALKSPEFIKLASQLDYNIGVGTKLTIMGEIIHAGEQVLAHEVETMTPEERQMLMYRAQLSQL